MSEQEVSELVIEAWDAVLPALFESLDRIDDSVEEDAKHPNDGSVRTSRINRALGVWLRSKRDTLATAKLSASEAVLKMAYGILKCEELYVTMQFLKNARSAHRYEQLIVGLIRGINQIRYAIQDKKSNMPSPPAKGRSRAVSVLTLMEMREEDPPIAPRVSVDKTPNNEHLLSASTIFTEETGTKMKQQEPKQSKPGIDVGKLAWKLEIVQFLLEKEFQAASKFVECTGKHINHPRETVAPTITLVDFLNLTNHFGSLARSARKRRQRVSSSSPVLKRILSRLERGLTVAAMAFRAQACLGTFQFPMCIFCLCEAGRILKNGATSIIRESKYSSDEEVDRSGPTPFVLIWARRFLQKLHSKIHLYFYTPLLQWTPHGEHAIKGTLLEVKSMSDDRLSSLFASSISIDTSQATIAAYDSKKGGMKETESEMIRLVQSLVTSSRAHWAFLLYDLATMREKGRAYTNVDYSNSMSYRLPESRTSAFGCLKEDREDMKDFKRKDEEGFDAWPCIYCVTPMDALKPSRFTSASSGSPRNSRHEGSKMMPFSEITVNRKLLWPTIVSLIMQQRQMLDNFSKAYSYREHHGKGKDMVFVIGQIEPGVFLAVVHKLKSRRDRAMIEKVSRICRTLRLVDEVGLLCPDAYYSLQRNRSKA